MDFTDLRMVLIIYLQMYGLLGVGGGALTINNTSVACAVGPSVNPLQNRETQHVEHCFAMCVLIF